MVDRSEKISGAVGKATFATSEIIHREWAIKKKNRRSKNRFDDDDRLVTSVFKKRVV